MAIDKVAEGQGGMMGGHSAGSWPRDVKQAYNLKCNSTPGSTVSGIDPYLALVMQCKEEAKNKKNSRHQESYLCTRTVSDSIYRRTVELHGAFLYNWP